MRKNILITLIIILIAIGGFSFRKSIKNEKGDISLLYLQFKVLEFANKYRNEDVIVVSKRDHLLYYCRNGEVVRNEWWNGFVFNFPVKVSLSSPYYHTPEGEMFISLKNPNSRYILFLGLSYPGTYGIHSAATHLASYLEREEKKNPEFSFVTKKDDTHGCVAVENRIIKYLYANVDERTPVLIMP